MNALSRAAAVALVIALAYSPPARADGAEDEAAGGAAGEGLVPVTEIFKGKVVSFTEDGEIELFYDFEDPAQLQDFEVSIPFRAIRTVTTEVERGKIRLKGTGSFRHRAVFGEKVRTELDFTPLRNRDFGIAVSEERESEIFTLYCLYDRYFSAGDNVFTPQNMIIKFIARDMTAKDDFQDWRYCGSRGAKPEIERGKTYRVLVERGDNQSLMVIDGDWKAKGKEAGRDLTTQMMAVYGYDADVRFDDLTLSGKLDPAYVKRARIDLSKTVEGPETAGDPTPDEPEEPALPADELERLRLKIAGYPVETRPPALAKMLRDADVPVPLRQEAADKALAVGHKRIVPFLVDGLYDKDVTARRLTFDVVKGLVGKTFGYRPDAPEAARTRAIQSLNKHISKNQQDFR